MRRLTKFILPIAIILFTNVAFAQDAKFGWPLACTQGENCWVVHHVDVDTAPTATKDYQCGHLTYDGHDGTDIAVRDLKAMQAGISVLSADDGIVMGGRDGVTDGHGTEAEMAAVKQSGRECGNGVLVKHANGWETQYCHMKKGSVVVTPGQEVKKGARLGMVGQSGMAQFPHLHFTVRHNGTVIDPYSGSASSAGCHAGADVRSLWDRPISYDPAMFYAAGFSALPPVYDDLVADASAAEVLPANSPSLLFWFMLYGAQKDDQISFAITDPNGSVFAQSQITQPKNQIRVFRFIGKKPNGASFQTGTYKGSATLTRNVEGKPQVVRTVERQVLVQ